MLILVGQGGGADERCRLYSALCGGTADHAVFGHAVDDDGVGFFLVILVGIGHNQFVALAVDVDNLDGGIVLEVLAQLDRKSVV